MYLWPCPLACARCLTSLLENGHILSFKTKHASNHSDYTSPKRKMIFHTSTSFLKGFQPGKVQTLKQATHPCLLWGELMRRAVRKLVFCICENKDADKLRGNSEADQRLCFRYIDSTIPLLPKYKISSL